jgi:DnaJ family protein C protein 8
MTRDLQKLHDIAITALAILFSTSLIITLLEDLATMADSEPKQEEYSWSRSKETTTATTPSSSKPEPTQNLDDLTKEAAASDADFLAILAKEEKEANKDDEIDRIRKAFRRNAYDVLDLQPGVPDEDIKKVYRKKSILVHPDKNASNPYAQDAFDRLAKAYQTLLDEKERALLDEAIADARMLLIRERKLTVDSEEVKDPDEDFMKAWKAKVYEVIRDNEMRRERQRRAQMQEEGRAQRKEEEELAERKRKREHEQNWEKTREQRVGSWRDFQKKATDEGKKGKKKLKVLG